MQKDTIINAMGITGTLKKLTQKHFTGAPFRIMRLADELDRMAEE